MSKDAYYFSHDANSRNDEKIISLRMDLGWEGYGIYWALIEMLRESATYELEFNCNRIAFALSADKDCINSVISNYDLFENNGEIFWSNSLKKRMFAKDQKSKKARESAQKRWDKCKSNANALKSQSDSNAKESKVKEKKKEDIREKEVIEYLNSKTGKSFRTAKGLKTRFSEGFTLEDAKKVIDIKCDEWLNDSNMNQYLRPQTLFSEKFDSYLNQENKTQDNESANPFLNGMN